MQQSSLIHFRQVIGAVRSENGLEAYLDHEKLRVDVIKADLLRIKISRGGKFDESPTFAMAIDPLAEAISKGLDRSFEVVIDDSTAILKTSKLELVLDLANFGFRLQRTDGTVAIESSPLGDAGSGYASLNDAFVVRRKAGMQDAIYGLGEKAGKQNRRGRDFTLWNLDVLNPSASGEFAKVHPGTHPRSDNTSSEFDPFYVSIPFYYQQDAETGHAAGSFIDNGYRGYYDFTGADTYDIRFEGGQYTEYLFLGPSMAQILEDYTWLTGRTQLPPMWALGYHQCRWNAYSQEQVLELAARHQADDVPLDTLWLDIDYMDGYRVFTWNNRLFPNPEHMLAQLKEKGIRVVTIVDPGVKFDPGYEVFDSGFSEDVFCKTEGGDIYIGQVWPGNTAFPDFVSESGRDWWGKLNARWVQSGLAGIWNDMNEPATGDISAERMRFGNGVYSHERYHNSYALLMAMGTVQGLRSAMPDLRTFVLSRAGSAGIQRFAANWMGDNFSRWDHLWVSIPMGTGLGLSGQSFVGADIGGFAENTNPELFARWIQYGALTPFARNHNQTNQIDQYVHAFGESVLEIARAAIKLRYRLLPYLYSAFVAASQTGEPVQRPLVFDYQYDEATRELDDEYLLGSQILVAPVLEPGAGARSVYLPEGEWFDWNTDERIAGGQRIQAAAPAEIIPIYARAGSVIPLFTEAPSSTDGYYPDALDLKVFVPSTDGVFVSALVEDDGLTFAALDGANFTTNMKLTRSGKQLTLEGAVTGSGFAAFRRTELRIHLIGAHKKCSEPVVIDNAGTDFSITFGL